MVQELSFFGLDSENPYHHLRKFELVCSCSTIAWMSCDTLRWKLFPFSLVEEARQWYTRTVASMNGNWGELRDEFCLKFFPESRLVALRKDIICFQQNEKESIGAAWARFLLLVKSGPVLSLPDYVLLEHFYSGLDMDFASYLDMTTEGSFAHKTLAEGMEILEIISENTSFVAEFTPSQEQHKSSDEDILAAELDRSLSIPLDSALETSLEPRVLEKEEI